MPESFDAAAAHRRFGAEFNNRAWDLIDQPSLTAEEAEELLHLAHASLLHWRQVGRPINLLRGYCLLSHACLSAHLPALAMTFAQRCVALSEQEVAGQTDFDRAVASDCMAQACLANGNATLAGQFRRSALEYAGKLADPADRSVFDRLQARGAWPENG